MLSSGAADVEAMRGNGRRWLEGGEKQTAGLRLHRTTGLKSSSEQQTNEAGPAFAGD